MQWFVARGYRDVFFHPSRGALVAVLFQALFLLTGCDRIFEDQSKRSLETAEKKFIEGDYKAAVRYYESALDGTAATAEVHYKLALLFDDKLKNPLAATYHFQRYLELKPDGSHVKEVRGFIQEDELKIAGSLSHGALMSQEDAARLKNDNLLLRQQIVELRANSKLAAARADGAPAGATGAGKSPPPGSTTYVVQHGDTLASIARKFYKGSTRWKDIQDANFNTLKGTVKLKAGMTLIIPK